MCVGAVYMFMYCTCARTIYTIIIMKERESKGRPENHVETRAAVIRIYV